MSALQKQIDNFSEKDNLDFERFKEKLTDTELLAAKIRYVGFKNDYNDSVISSRKQAMTIAKIILVLTVVATIVLSYFKSEPLVDVFFNIIPASVISLLMLIILIRATSPSYKPSPASAVFAIHANKDVGSEFYDRDIALAKELLAGK